MFSRIRDAIRARRAARLEVEALVWRFGSRGAEMARTFAGDGPVPEDRRSHYRRVANIAGCRHAQLTGLDTATRYEVLARWRVNGLANLVRELAVAS